VIPRIIDRFSLDVYEIIIDLTEASGRSRRHGAKKSGSTVLFILHSVGVDYELSALFEKHRISPANCSKSALFFVKCCFALESVPFARNSLFFPL
jgi:hypothetical protein